MKASLRLAASSLVFAVGLTSLIGCSGDDGVIVSPDAGANETGPSPTQDAGTHDATTPDAGDAGSDAAPTSDASDATTDAHDAGSDADADADADAGTVPAHCIDLSGQYQENADILHLTRASCGSLTWERDYAVADDSPGWTHVYTTDGVARPTTDERGAAIIEEARVDDKAMHVKRTWTSTGEVAHQTITWTTTPCNLLFPDGTYLQRVTTDDANVQTACELWYYDDGCPGRTHECDANPSTKCESNTYSDPNNCGGCGTVCGAANTSQNACVQGVCKQVCAAGFKDCNRSSADGCEIDLTSDVSNCGACGAVCGSAGTTSVTCASGSCVLACDATHGNCDGNAANGCEDDTSTDPANCGGCGVDCGGTLCAASTCQGHGTTLVSSADTLQSPYWQMQVDGANLYYRDLEGRLWAVDKVHGGTPQLAASSTTDMAVAGDGSVYYLVGRAPDPVTLSRWVSAAGSTQVITTLSGGSFGIAADSMGVVWGDRSSTSSFGGPITIRAWSPGDAAPHDLYTGVAQSDELMLALTPSVIVRIDGTLGVVPRAGGSLTTLYASPTGFLSNYSSGFVVGPWLYLITSTRIDRAPLAGGAPVEWTPGGFEAMAATDGVSVFGEAGHNVVEYPVASVSPTPVDKAYVSTNMPYPFAVDANAFYVFDVDAKQVRRVTR